MVSILCPWGLFTTHYGVCVFVLLVVFAVVSMFCFMVSLLSPTISLLCVVVSVALLFVSILHHRVHIFFPCFCAISAFAFTHQKASPNIIKRSSSKRVATVTRALCRAVSFVVSLVLAAA